MGVLILQDNVQVLFASLALQFTLSLRRSKRPREGLLDSTESHLVDSIQSWGVLTPIMNVSTPINKWFFFILDSTINSLRSHRVKPNVEIFYLTHVEVRWTYKVMGQFGELKLVNHRYMFIVNTDPSRIQYAGFGTGSFKKAKINGTS